MAREQSEQKMRFHKANINILHGTLQDTEAVWLPHQGTPTGTTVTDAEQATAFTWAEQIQLKLLCDVESTLLQPVYRLDSLYWFSKVPVNATETWVSQSGHNLAIY